MTRYNYFNIFDIIQNKKIKNTIIIYNINKKKIKRWIQLTLKNTELLLSILKDVNPRGANLNVKRFAQLIKQIRCVLM